MAGPLRAAIGAATLLAGLQAPAGRAEDAWAVCIAAPTRACVLALAAETAASNDDAYQKVHMFGRLAAAEAMAGLAAEADRDFARVPAIIDAEQGIGADVRRAQYSDALAASLAEAGLVDLGQVEAALGDDAAATADFAQLRAQAEVLSGDGRSMLSMRLAHGPLNSGKIAEALALQDEFKQPLSRDIFLIRVAETQMGAGGGEDAPRSIQDISEPRTRFDGLERLAEAPTR